MVSMRDMFLRFYNVTPERIHECMSKFKELGYNFVYTVDPLPFPFPTSGESLVSKEVNVLFDTPEGRSLFRADERAIDIYRSMASTFDPSVVSVVDLTPEAVKS